MKNHYDRPDFCQVLSKVGNCIFQTCNDVDELEMCLENYLNKSIDYYYNADIRDDEEFAAEKKLFNEIFGDSEIDPDRLIPMVLEISKKDSIQNPGYGWKIVKIFEGKKF
jgi:uncharacterized protein YpmS